MLPWGVSWNVLPHPSESRRVQVVVGVVTGACPYGGEGPVRAKANELPLLHRRTDDDVLRRQRSRVMTMWIYVCVLKSPSCHVIQTVVSHPVWWNGDSAPCAGSSGPEWALESVMSELGFRSYQHSYFPRTQWVWQSEKDKMKKVELLDNRESIIFTLSVWKGRRKLKSCMKHTDFDHVWE